MFQVGATGIKTEEERRFGMFGRDENVCLVFGGKHEREDPHLADKRIKELK
jgi:hypothetical protein